MDMKYFDAHTHTNFAAYDADREEVIERARVAGVMMNIVGSQRDTSASAIALAEKYDHMVATIGLHPIHTDKSYHDEQELGAGGKAFTSRGEEFEEKSYLAMARHPKVVAIGECGLDYFRCDESTKKKQIEAFVQQIELANTVNKPLMLHIRASSRAGVDAYNDAFSILKTHAKVQGDVHFFAGDWATAKKFLAIGFTLSFNGVLTFTHDYDEVVRNTPLDMMLSETDAPYLAPIPYRGKRNEPVYVVEVVKAIARIRGEDEEKVREALLTNAHRLFHTVIS
jgi:TatD DNase family protein